MVPVLRPYPKGEVRSLCREVSLYTGNQICEVTTNRQREEPTWPRYLPLRYREWLAAVRFVVIIELREN